MFLEHYSESIIADLEYHIRNPIDHSSRRNILAVANANDFRNEL